MLLTIKVKPAPHLRAQFAKWAVGQDPKVDTCSHTEFCVPPDQFTHAPEELLIGAIVDGHRYRSPLEDEQLAAAREREAAPDEPLPDVEPVDPADAGEEPASDGGQEAAAPVKTRARRAPAAGSRRKARQEGDS